MCLYFGRGDFGRLGHGNSSDLFTPLPIKALHGIRIKQIACGDSHCLAVTMDGEVQRYLLLLTYSFFYLYRSSVLSLVNTYLQVCNNFICLGYCVHSCLVDDNIPFLIFLYIKLGTQPEWSTWSG